MAWMGRGRASQTNKWDRGMVERGPDEGIDEHGTDKREPAKSERPDERRGWGRARLGGVVGQRPA